MIVARLLVDIKIEEWDEVTLVPSGSIVEVDDRYGTFLVPTLADWYPIKDEDWVYFLESEEE